jgi:hypothetical protein
VEWIDLVEDVLRSKNLWKHAVGEDVPEEKTEEFLANDARQSHSSSQPQVESSELTY